jgi:hypothetical protein
LNIGEMILRGGKQNYPEKKHHKSHMEWPGFEVRSPQWETRKLTAWG